MKFYLEKVVHYQKRSETLFWLRFGTWLKVGLPLVVITDHNYSRVNELEPVGYQ